MWLWILSALLLILVWAAWWFLQATGLVSLWVPLAVTAAVALLLVGLLVYRRLRAARAARALEKAIAQQAQEQALAARPERVAEIQELHRQITQGIAALKASKLGGGKRGADALYVLPWYAMVGPPGAGKTTALRHSGLVFPYLDPSGGGVRGVGGTRNCDWWFTNEAILLDTAGRYTTESDDHDEWMAFLGELIKFRGAKPLNGVIVAVSVSELLDATDDQVAQIGRKIRERIDEMQSTLKMVLPVYVLFTKVDLIAGFTEFFGDLKKSERAQAWGTTVRLDADKAQPGKLFDREFDVLVEKLHLRTIKRMGTERSRDAKEKIYQFPLEFAAIKRNLSDFLAATFAPATSPQGKGGKLDETANPIFRGFYFTSGTQEGRPLDRVVGAMGRAFGLRGAAPAEEPAANVESKSFFLRDVFMNVVFPDQVLAVRSEAELRRLRLQRFVVAAVAAFVALVFLVPALLSFLNNRKLIADTGQITQDASSVNWNDGANPGMKADRLTALRERADLLARFHKDGADLPYWLMYQDRLYQPTLNEYIQSLRVGFVIPTKQLLEDKLRQGGRTSYIEPYNNLKTYLLLGDKDEAGLPYRAHLADADLASWEKYRLTTIWTEALLIHNKDLTEGELRAKLFPHVAFYVDHLQDGSVDGDPLDRVLVGSVRDNLTKMGPLQAYYERFVTPLNDEKIDPNGDLAKENLKYPPITLTDLFADRPEVFTVLSSAQKVEGPYTQRGHVEVLDRLSNAYKILEREKWVVPLTSEEVQRGDQITLALNRVRQQYDQQYIVEWEEFFHKLTVKSPEENLEAIKEYKILATSDWPYARLLRALHDNTQFDDLKEETVEDEALTDGGVADQLKQKLIRRVEQKTRGVKLNMLLPGQKGERPDPVPEHFKSMVLFGVPPLPPKTAEGQPPPPPVPTNLSTYIGHLEGLGGEMGNIQDGPPNADTKAFTGKFEDAVKASQGLLLKMDDTGQKLMEPLLMNPLKGGYRAVVRHAGGAASGLWEVMVWPSYRDKVKDRYPFDLAARKDASFDDAVAFLKPKDGILWGFYNEHLKNFHTKVDHDYVPEAHLEPRYGRSARGFTPFNANLYNCLHRADEITDALWPGFVGDKPKVEFAINLKTVSPIVSEVIFELDGQRKVYRNEKEFWQPFTWPGPKPLGARLQVRGAGGLDEEIKREGPWGMFRLIEIGTSTAEKDKDAPFTVTWQMTAPPVTVTMEVKPVRGNHPFPSSFFRATNCPPTIGDRFKKGS